MINRLLEFTHFGEECVEVCIGLAHEHRDFVEPLNFVVHAANAVLNVLQNSAGLVENRLLHQDSDGITLRQCCFTVRGSVEPGHDLENRGFSGAVRPNHTDFCAGEERHGDVVKDQLVAHCLAGLDHCVDEFSHDLPINLSRRADKATPRAEQGFDG